MLTLESQHVNRYIKGLAPEIKANVTSSNPAIIQGVMSMANHLTTNGIKDGIFKKKENAEDKKRSSNQFKNQGQVQRQYAGQHSKCAKCNFHHSGAVEAPQDPNIVTGTFSLNDHFATILFDSGAGYNFISTNFLPLIDVKTSVISPGYEIKIANNLKIETNKHEVHLKLILELLEREKLFGKFLKCEFWLQEVCFLGHIVNSKGIHVDLSNIEAVKNWKPPKTPTEIRSFIGLARYYRRFIANFSKIAKPLTLLTRKDKNFERVQTEYQKPSGLLQQPEILEWKWEKITMDFITILPRTSSGHNTIWVIVYRLTKSAHFLAIREDYKMERFARLYINKIVERHGVPVSIISNHDTHFTLRFSLQKALGTQLDMSIAYHP
ncbi:putative reverse transcriptase domain-containing protein [Tanacetum coccineum]